MTTFILLIGSFCIGYIFVSIFEKIDLWIARDRGIDTTNKKYSKKLKLGVASSWAILSIII